MNKFQNHDKMLKNSKIVALVGRPNVGKSTLFNRLSLRKKNIVHDQAGVTRDRIYADAALGPLEFTVVDTPGLENAAIDKLEYRMMLQTMEAIEEADLVCLMVDNISGVTAEDKIFARSIQKTGKPCILIANKCEKTLYHDKSLYRLGFGQPVAISSAHGDGMNSLYEAFAEYIGDEDQKIPSARESNCVQIAICGRPNAGKSSFINAIIGNKRLLVGPEAGITRESVTIDLEYKENSIKLVDTAGLRRKANISETLEKMSASDATESIRYANTVVLMLDATCPLEQQDLKIANYILQEGRSMVIAVNKWDLIDNDKKKDYQEEIDYQLAKIMPQVKGIKVSYISSINSANILQTLEDCIETYNLWNTKISTSKLNDWLRFTVNEHSLPLSKKLGRRIKLKYVTQINTRPPAFKFFTNDPRGIPPSYKQYILNALRRDFKLAATPIRMFFAKSDNPYASKK